MSTVRAASPAGAGRVAGSVATAREAELLVENARLRVQVEALDERLRLREDHRRALLHILQDQHQSNLKLENARKAMIHIMDDLRKTTEEITLELDLSPANPVVTGSPIQLEQVFMNILANARDALQDAPLKVLRIRSGIKDDRLEMAISDSGPGIPPGLERRIFDPFFTTKDVGHGTGLGLSIAYGIINEHGGTISVVSPPGEGATFLIHLPLAPAETEETSRGRPRWASPSSATN